MGLEYSIPATAFDVLREITVNAHDPEHKGTCRYCKANSPVHLDWCPMNSIGKFVAAHGHPLKGVDQEDAKTG